MCSVVEVSLSRDTMRGFRRRGSFSSHVDDLDNRGRLSSVSNPFGARESASTWWDLEGKRRGRRCNDNGKPNRGPESSGCYRATQEDLTFWIHFFWVALVQLSNSCWNSQVVIANGTNICFCALSLSRNEAQFSLMTSRILPTLLLRGRTRTVTHSKSIPKEKCWTRDPFCPCKSPRHQWLYQRNR